jgi:hypothetical protein
MNRKILLGLLLFFTLAGCVASGARNVTPRTSETVAVRAVTYEWMTYPGQSIEATPPLYSLPRVTQSDCGNLTLTQCQDLYDCARSLGKSGKCNQQFFGEPGKPGVVPRMFGGTGGVRPAKINPFWLQASWFTDSANSTGCASDANNCSQSSCGAGGSNQGPCLTKGETFARFAGYAPIYQANMTWTFMSSEPNNDDPGIFNPIIMSFVPDNTLEGPILALTGTTSASSTTITALTAMVPSTNTPLQITATGLGRYLAIQNTSRSNSIAWTDGQSSPSAISQPLNPISLGSSGNPPVVGTVNNSWTNGDSINNLTLPSIWWNQIVPTMAALSGQGYVALQHIKVPENVPAGIAAGDDYVMIGNGVIPVESAFETSVAFVAPYANYLANFGSRNCQFLGGVFGGPNVAAIDGTKRELLLFDAGIIAGINATSGGVSIRNSMIINNTGFNDRNRSSLVSGHNFWQGVWVGQNSVIKVLSGGTIDFNQLGAAVLWGAGTIDANLGQVLYSKAVTSATTFPLSGGLAIQGGTTVCCNTVANPSVENCSITLSATSLGAGACSSGTPALGDRGFLPGSGAFIGL